MIFAEKAFPVILRRFRGVLSVKWGCGVCLKSEHAKRKICPPPLNWVHFLTPKHYETKLFTE